MNEVQLITITFRGLPCFRYATSAEPGEANAQAGRLMDRLADYYGDGFGYAVRSVPFRRTCDGDARVFDAARSHYETGAWLQSGLA